MSRRIKISEELLSGAMRVLAKEAFSPPPPAADPSMMGGGMPMDPSMMGGGMPMDPAAGAAPPPPPPPPPLPPPVPAGADVATAQAVAEQTAPPATSGKSAKLDPNQIYLEMGRIRTLITNLYEQLGLSLPSDILNDSKQIEAAGGTPPAASTAEKIGEAASLASRIEEQCHATNVATLLLRRLSEST